MKSIYIFFLISTIIFFAACQSEPFNDNEDGVDIPSNLEGSFVKGELLVKFSPELTAVFDQQPVLTRSGGATRSGVKSVDQLLETFKGYQVERVFPVDSRHEDRVRESGMHLWYVIRFDEKFDVNEVADQLNALESVETVSLNRIIKKSYKAPVVPLSVTSLQKMVQSQTRSTNDVGTAFNDPLLPKQWALINNGDMFTSPVKSVKDADVQCKEAWKKTTGDPSIIVAVVDEGVMFSHPDLAQNMWINEAEVQMGANIDRDGNGYKGDRYGYNFVNGSGTIGYDQFGDVGHGSHVAGIISAVNNNGIGISSVAGGNGNPNSGVKIMSCQIFSGNKGATMLNVGRAIKYAADNNAVILQCSWGVSSGKQPISPGYKNDEEWKSDNDIEFIALDYFLHNAGSPNSVIDGGIVIYASGNEYSPMSSYPGAYPDYVSVSATAADFTPCSYTNYGPGVTISAPGGDRDYYYEFDYPDGLGIEGSILSTVPYHVSETGYGYMDGTSMACPHVSGVVALGLSYAAKLRLHFKADEFKQMLYNTTVDIDPYMSGMKQYYYGLQFYGLTQLGDMNLSNYRSQMGHGQVNAYRLLQSIEGSGSQLLFPNLLLNKGYEVAVLPSYYFIDGNKLTFTVNISDTSIASCVQDGTKLRFKGLKTGVTTASITASNGKKHTFNITVRNKIGDNGWM